MNNTISRPEAGCGAAIHDEDGRLLLIQRLKEPEAGAWGLPGGKVDFGERAEDTARREITEELGVEIGLHRRNNRQGGWSPLDCPCLYCPDHLGSPPDHGAAKAWRLGLVLAE